MRGCAHRDQSAGRKLKRPDPSGPVPETVVICHLDGLAGIQHDTKEKPRSFFKRGFRPLDAVSCQHWDRLPHIRQFFDRARVSVQNSVPRHAAATSES